MNFDIHAGNAPICDFCSDPNVYASHVCQPHVADTLTNEAGATLELRDGDGVWAACQECDRLIRADDWNGLLERSVEQFRKQYGVVIPGLRFSIKRLHDQFRATYRKEV